MDTIPVVTILRVSIDELNPLSTGGYDIPSVDLCVLILILYSLIEATFSKLYAASGREETVNLVSININYDRSLRSDPEATSESPCRYSREREYQKRFAA